MILTESLISARLKRKPKKTGTLPFAFPKSTGSTKWAAVLVPLMLINRSWHLLFIRRAENAQDDHSGQVAFPGGRHEPNDPNLESTALREAKEELGLPSDEVRLLGKLRDHYSVTNYRITPVVGRIPWPYPLQIDPLEVSRWFTIPVDWLANPANRELRAWKPSADNPAFPVIYFRDYDGETLWGATARITVELIETLSEVSPEK
jgi:8-oxo-dGTP pyrophosphatase MutT (NUDIX family)